MFVGGVDEYEEAKIHEGQQQNHHAERRNPPEVLEWCSLVCLVAIPHFDASFEKTHHIFIL